MKKVDVLILAGGESRRMQKNKALLMVGQQTLIEHLIKQLPAQLLNNIYIAGDKNELPEISKAVFLDDFLLQKYQGPLSGIARALSVSTTDYLWVLACDILQLPKNTLSDLLVETKNTNKKIIYAQSNSGQQYPLIALWHRSLRAAVVDYLASGERRVMKFLDQQNSLACDLNDLDDRLCNMNTQDDFEKALTVFKAL